jgi:hypothetical protein
MVIYQHLDIFIQQEILFQNMICIVKSIKLVEY